MDTVDNNQNNSPSNIHSQNNKNESTSSTAKLKEDDKNNISNEDETNNKNKADEENEIGRRLYLEKYEKTKQEITERVKKNIRDAYLHKDDDTDFVKFLNKISDGKEIQQSPDTTNFLDYAKGNINSSYGYLALFFLSFGLILIICLIFFIIKYICKKNKKHKEYRSAMKKLNSEDVPLLLQNDIP